GARLVYVLALTPHLRGHGDSSYYHQFANVIADGHGFVDPGNGTPTALHPPLFPLLLALATKLGAGSYLGHRVAVCLVGAAVLVIAPWSIRNASTFDRFVPIATNEGNLVAGANCRDTYYGRDTGSWQIRCVPPGPVEDESVAAARFHHVGVSYARGHAGRW